MLFLAEEIPHDPNPVLPIWQELLVGTIAFALLTASYVQGALADEH